MTGTRVAARADDAAEVRSSTSLPLRAAAVLVGIVWLPVLLVWGNAPFTITFDDSWYYFEIARNLATGHGSSFDTLDLTNGYHPLWMGLATIPYTLGVDGLAAVRTLLLVQLACWVATLLLIARVAMRLHPGPVSRTTGLTAAAVLFLVGANPFVLKTIVNGLESGIVVVVQAGILAIACARRGRLLSGTRRDRLLLSALLALAVLARTDALLLLACAGLWALVEAWSDREAAVRRLVELFALPAVTTGLYLLSNQVFFGDPRQVSGEVKRLALTGGRLLGLLLTVAVALAIGAWARTRLSQAGVDARSSARLPRTGTFLARTGFFPPFCLLLVAYYLLLSAQQWLWYFAPIALYVAFLAPLVAADLVEGATAEASDDRSARRARTMVQAILVGTLAVTFVYEVFQFADPGQRSIQLADRRAGEWMSANLPQDAVVGSWDAGVIGYFADRPVVNLDGVVNSFDWLEAVRNGTTARFLEDRDVRYFANHAAEIDGQDPGIHQDVSRLLAPDVADRLRQLKRFEFVYSGNIEGSSTDQNHQWATFVYEVPPRSP